jgi:hypothetical protein
MQQNDTHRHNVHDPSANARYFDVSNAFQHLGGLTEAVSQAFLNPPPPPARTVTDITDDFARSSEQLHIAETRNFVVGINFLNNVLQILVAEHSSTLSAQQAEIGSGNDTSTEMEQNGIIE